MIRNTFICFFLFIMLTVLSQETYNEYSQVDVHEFALGNSNNQLGYSGEPVGPSYGVSGFGFDKSDNLYIGDYANCRFLILNPDYSYKGEIIRSVPDDIIITFDINGNLLLRRLNIAININMQGETLLYVNLRNIKLKDEKKLRQDPIIITDNLLIAHLTDGSTISIPAPSADPKTNRSKIQDHVATLSSIKVLSRSAVDPESVLRIEKYPPENQQSVANLFRGVNPGNSYGKFEGYIVFRGDEMLTRDCKTFYYYYNELRNEGEIKIGNAVDLTVDMDAIWKRRLYEDFLGEDRDGNLYWDISYKIYVFNKTGHLIDAFEITDMERICAPAIHPNGDIYLMNFSDNKHILSKVSRVW